MIPVLTRKYGGTRIGDYEFSLFKHLGAGIILSTGFIHMLPPAFENLTNVCLSDGWLEYTAYAGLLAMLSILFTQFIQTAAVSYLRNSNDLKGDHRVAANGNGSHSSWSPIASPSSGVPSKAPTPDSGDSADSDSVIVDTTRGDGNDVEMALHQAQHHLHHHSRRQHDHDHDGDAAEVEHVHSLILAHRQRRQVMVYILELGIATHSFIIGLALGVSRGTELTALMIALAFHQFFEGMALSATVMDAGFKTSLQIIFAVVFYSTTTPLGIAIGIAIESQFNANSPAALVSTGVVEAVSAGILIYDSCVNSGFRGGMRSLCFLR